MCAREEILRLAFRELSAQRGTDPGAIEVTIRCHGVELRYKSDPGEFTRRIPEGLSRQQKKILEVMPTGEAWSAERIAREAGYEMGSHVRQALADLVKGGLLENNDDGYQVV